MRSTYTVAILEVNEETYKDIHDRIKALGPEYNDMFMSDGAIDLTHVAIMVEKK